MRAQALAGTPLGIVTPHSVALQVIVAKEDGRSAVAPEEEMTPGTAASRDRSRTSLAGGAGIAHELGLAVALASAGVPSGPAGIRPGAPPQRLPPESPQVSHPYLPQRRLPFVRPDYRQLETARAGLPKLHGDGFLA